ncbi:MAG TPA: hypothetical protein PK916_08910 [Bacteroidota bacterium]|nr:hypothetical protein [Bacteroidota bacterium]
MEKEKYTRIPEEKLAFDPEAQKALQAGSVAYQAYLRKLNGEDDDDDGAASPSDQGQGQEGHDDAGGGEDQGGEDNGSAADNGSGQDSAEDADELDPVFDETDYAAFRKAGLVDENGKFLSKYKTVDALLAAVKAKDQAISSKFGDWIKNNPEEARELLADAGAIDATPAPQDRQKPGEGQQSAQDAANAADDAGAANSGADVSVEEFVAKTLETIPTTEAMLAEKYKGELEDAGLTVPTTAQEWRDLADVAPGLHAEMREAYHDLKAQRQHAEELLHQAGRARAVRIAQLPTYEKQVIDHERQALLDEGIPDALIDKAINEVLAQRKNNKDVNELYFDDRDQFGNRIFAPALKQGAIAFHLRNEHFTEVVQAMGAEGAKSKAQKRQQHFQAKERRAGLFPASLAGVPGEGRDVRRGVNAPQPTPEQYRDSEWRMQNLRTQKDRDAAKNWIDSLPEARRSKYY